MIDASVVSVFVAVLSETDAKVVLGLFVAVPATLSALAAMYAAQARKELRKNSGSTARDALDRVEDFMKKVDARLSAVEDFITNPKERQ